MNEDKKYYELPEELKTLSSKDQKELKDFVNTFIKSKKHKEEFIEIIKRYEEINPEDVSALWSIVVLGERKDTDSIDTLLEILKKPTGLLAVGVYDALLSFSEAKPKIVFEKCKEFLDNYFKEMDEMTDSQEWSMKEQISKDRVYVYDVLGRLESQKKVSKEAKEYLQSIVEKDYPVNGRIVLNLLRWPLEDNMASFLRRQMEVALVSRRGVGAQNREYIEAKWALINYKKGAFGKDYPYSKEEEKKTWEERWEPLFEQWKVVESEKLKVKSKGGGASKENKDSSDEKKEPTEADKKKFEEEKKKWEEKMKDEQEKAKEFNNFEMPSFKIEEYLQVRTPGEFEKRFEDKLQEIGVSKEWDATKIQVKISQEIDFYTSLAYFLKELNLAEDKDKSKDFSESFYELWSITPKESWGGITPVEKSIYDKSGEKPGRNEPCPCGSVSSDGTPKKYKKCCMQKYS